MLPSATTDRVLTVAVSGVQRHVRLRGNVAGRPLLVLHGGPGAAESAALPRGLLAWERPYLTVHWDQPGAGRAGPPPASLELLERDAAALLEWICAHTGHERIALLGHSWGSALALRLARRYPDRVLAVATSGQLIDGLGNELRSRSWLEAAAERSPSAALRGAVERLPRPPYGRDASALLRQRALVALLGGLFHRRRRLALHGVRTALGGGAAYSAVLRASLRMLWPQVERLDLRDAPQPVVPTALALGRYDGVTPTGAALAWAAQRGVPTHDFDRSAHMPHLEEPERFAEVLASVVADAIRRRSRRPAPRAGS